jgi:hypothetical protein
VKRNRDYFAEKLRAEKQRNDVLRAVNGEIPYDFVLLDTRGNEALSSGHIPGAWSAGLEELERVIPQLRKE